MGALLFAASLTPSLIPRNQVVQGVLSGFAFGAGYGIGVVLRSVYRYLELPGLSSASLRVVRPVAIVACLGLMATASYHVKTWQNAYWQLYQRFPRRVSTVAGVVLAVFLIITLTNGVLVEYTFRVLDRSFQQYDALLEPDRPQPLIAERAGWILRPWMGWSTCFMVMWPVWLYSTLI